MSISFKKSMLAIAIVSSLTAGFTGIAAAAGGHGGGGGRDGGGGHFGGGHHGFGGRGYFGLPYFNSGYGYDGMYQAWPSECSNLAWRLERNHVPYRREQAILANRGCA